MKRKTTVVHTETRRRTLEDLKKEVEQEVETELLLKAEEYRTQLRQQLGLTAA